MSTLRLHTDLMPDRAVFPGLHRSWRRVGRAVRGSQPPEVVASLAEEAFAAQLRADPARAKLGKAAAAISDAGDVRAVRQFLDAADLAHQIAGGSAQVRAPRRQRSSTANLLYEPLA
jgi:hypothetical protein